MFPGNPLKPLHDKVRPLHHALIDKIRVGATAPCTGTGIGQLEIHVPQTDRVIQHPVVDGSEQAIAGVEPVEVAIEHQLHPMPLSLLRQRHLLNFIKGPGIAIQPADNIEHILGDRARLLTQILGRIAVRQRTAAAFAHRLRPPQPPVTVRQDDGAIKG